MSETSGTLKIYTLEKQYVLQVLPKVTIDYIQDHMLKMQEVSDYVLSVSNHLLEHDPEVLSFRKEEPIVVKRFLSACVQLELDRDEKTRKKQEKERRKKSRRPKPKPKPKPKLKPKPKPKTKTKIKANLIPFGGKDT